MFRLDRLFTLYFFHPLAKRFPPKNGVRIPILMYHSISDERETGHPYYWINTSPALFAKHMKFLHDNGYQVISLSAAVDLIKQNSESSFVKSNSGSVLLNQRIKESSNKLDCSSQPISNQSIDNSTNKPVNYVVLTFDDGYRDFYTSAFEVLKEYGFSATVFIPTAFIDNSNTGLKGKRHLTWREVRGLQAEGIEFGSHTANHPKLNSLKPEWIEHEIKSSKEIIEDKTGYQVKSFSNPYKFPEEDLGFIELLQACLQKAGYQNGVSTRIGTVHQKNEAFFLRRIPVNSDDDFSLLRAKLDGSYDWLSGFQTFYKRLTGTKKNNGIFSPPQTSNQPVTNKLLNGTK